MNSKDDCSEFVKVHPKAEFKEFEPRLDAVQTWLIQLKIVYRECFRFEPALNWNQLLVVQRRGSNSLNSASSFLHLWFPVSLNLFLPRLNQHLIHAI